MSQVLSTLGLNNDESVKSRRAVITVTNRWNRSDPLRSKSPLRHPVSVRYTLVRGSKTRRNYHDE